MHKVELLAPAGDLDKLKVAIENGADAVYIGGEVFGMKSSIKDFTKDEMVEGVKYAHDKNKKVYVNVNLIPHDVDFIQFDEYLLQLAQCEVDGLIVGDPGVLEVIKKVIPQMKVHLNEQANTTNYVSANFWYNQGVRRISLAKELSLEEVSQVRAKTPLDMEIEVMVHGEMCISYSGRRLISNFLTGKESDMKQEGKLQEWKYSLLEEKRPDEYYPVYEDKGGTFLFNSKELCMINHVQDIIKAGVTTLKIEGRMKDTDYLSTVVKTYRNAIDEFYKNPNDYKVDSAWEVNLRKTTNRDYTTGFYLDEMTN